MTWEQILDFLQQAFSDSSDKRKYNNLWVRYMAWEAFRIHTCFGDENKLFDSRETSEWWKDGENRKKVLNALEAGRRSPFCR